MKQLILCLILCYEALTACGDSSSWKYPIPGYDDLTFNFVSQMNSGICEHQLVVNSICNRYAVKYTTTNNPSPFNPPPLTITFTEVTQNWVAPITCSGPWVTSNHIAEAEIIQTLVGSVPFTRCYDIGVFRNSIRFGLACSNPWGKWAKFHSGKTRIWFL